MHPVVVNGMVALTGIVAGVATAYVPAGDVRIELGAYAMFVLGYVVKRFGDESYRPAIERGAP